MTGPRATTVNMICTILADVCYGQGNSYQLIFVVCGQGNSYLLMFVVCGQGNNYLIMFDAVKARAIYLYLLCSKQWLLTDVWFGQGNSFVVVNVTAIN